MLKDFFIPDAAIREIQKILDYSLLVLWGWSGGYGSDVSKEEWDFVAP